MLVFVIALAAAGCSGSSSGDVADPLASNDVEPSDSAPAASEDTGSAVPASGETTAETPGASSTDSDAEVTSEDLFEGLGVLSLQTADFNYTGTGTSCIVDGGTQAIKVNLQAEATGMTDAGEPFYASISHVEQDFDGDGLIEALITVSLFEGQNSADGTADPSHIRIYSQTNTSERSGYGDLDVQLSEGTLRGWGSANDLNGIIADAEEPFTISFSVDCL